MNKYNTVSSKTHRQHAWAAPGIQQTEAPLILGGQTALLSDLPCPVHMWAVTCRHKQPTTVCTDTCTGNWPCSQAQFLIWKGVLIWETSMCSHTHSAWPVHNYQLAIRILMTNLIPLQPSVSQGAKCPPPLVTKCVTITFCNQLTQPSAALVALVALVAFWCPNPCCN